MPEWPGDVYAPSYVTDGADKFVPCAICDKPIVGGRVQFTDDGRLVHSICADTAQK